MSGTLTPVPSPLPTELLAAGLSLPLSKIEIELLKNFRATDKEFALCFAEMSSNLAKAHPARSAPKLHLVPPAKAPARPKKRQSAKRQPLVNIVGGRHA